MKRVILLATICLMVLQGRSQDCGPTSPVITTGSSAIICEGGSLTLSTSNGNAWTQKSSFGGTARVGAVGFSIAAKGYIGTGTDALGDKRDFWEYDPITDVWTQKANFGGAPRRDAVGFGTATKGYIGTGYNGTIRFSDIWEYDPGANTWTAKAILPGGVRSAAVGFSVGALGYIGTGTDGTTLFKDFYSFNPATNVWTARANFGGTARLAAVGYGTSTLGYIGTGFDVSGDTRDFWQYNPSTNTWLQRVNFGGGVRSAAFSFAIGTRGYIGAGQIGSIRQQDFWEYNPGTNAWTKRSNFGGGTRTRVAAFSIGGRGYAGTGATALNVKDFWEYEPPLTLLWSTAATTASIVANAAGYYAVTASNHLGCSYTSADIYVGFSKPEPEITPGGTANICTGGSVVLTVNNSNVWTQGTNVGGFARRMGVGFNIGPKGYIGTGFDGTTYYQDFWEYDPDLTTWTQKASLTTARSGAVGFGIGSKGYIGTGGNATTRFNDFWEFDPVGNTWTAKANFAGAVRRGAVGFSIGSKGYIGTGENGLTRFNDFWQYDPVTDKWSSKTAFTGLIRSYAVGFSIENKGYIGTGSNGLTRYKDFWEYDPVGDGWSVKTPFGGSVRDGAVGFSIATKGYIGNGYELSAKNDFWEYDPVANSWNRKADFAGGIRDAAVGFSIGAKGYVGMGWDGVSVNKKDFWEYEPQLTLAWSTGATTASIVASDSGFYNVTVTNHLGCASTSLDTYIAVSKPDVVINPQGILNVCQGSSSIQLSTPNNSNQYSIKSNFPDNGRAGAVGFSIGAKGYIGTGEGEGSIGWLKDFWEYNTILDSWTQKADFGGNKRLKAVGFAIGSKGYIGTGYTSSGPTKDFWEYNPVANSWTQKANFGGAGRCRGVGFSVGGRGYIGTGTNYVNAGNPLATIYTDFWEYNPLSDQWNKKADFGGTPRFGAVGFGIGIKGYLGTGFGAGSPPANLNDFWEYDPQTDNWLRKANFNSQGVGDAVGFNLGSFGCIGAGWYYVGPGVANYSSLIRRYDPLSDTWLIPTSLPSSLASSGFSIGAKGYIVGGALIGSSNKLNRVLEFDPGYQYAWSNGGTNSITIVGTINSSINTLTKSNILGCSATSVATIINVDTTKSTINPAGTVSICAGDNVTLSAPASNVWTQKANIDGAVFGRQYAVGFNIGNKGYFGTGTDGTYKKDFWEYDPQTNGWSQKADFDGTGRFGAVGFSIGNKGYIGTGINPSLNSYYNDFWEYDPVLNLWNRKADFLGGQRQSAVGFSIGNKGYIGTGYDGLLKNDFWEFDPISNSWTSKANVPGFARQDAVGFNIGSKGYVGTGSGSVGFNDFYEYDPVLNQWNQKANFGGGVRTGAVGFNIGTKGYVGTGDFSNDFWEFDPVSNQWVQKNNFAGGQRNKAIGFSIGNKGYVGTGFYISNKKDFWEYKPELSYSWSSGQNTPTITTDTAGIYTLTVTTKIGCVATSLPTTVAVNSTNTWAGGGTNNWHTASNWSCGKVPNNPRITAVINNGAVPMPVMTADVLVKNLVMNGTSTVDINGNSFSINGAITGTGTLKGSASSNLTLKGTAGNISFASSSNTIKDLLLTDTATATLGNALDIAAGSSPGSVTVNTNAVLTTGGFLTLKSDVNGTARVGILTGAISGSVTVERYVNTGLLADGRHLKSWQFLSTPAKGQTIRQAWQENGTAPAGFGTWITGTGTGFDTITASPSMKYFNATGINWTAVTNTGTTLEQKLGYMLFVRGDRTVTTYNGTPNPTTMRSKGTLFQPSDPPPSVPVAANKFQTVGNPYASQIEFSKVRIASTGINDVFYVWDPKLNGTYGLGGYQTITGVAGYIPTVGVPPTGNPATVYYPAGIPAPFIESGQAVFVKGNGTGGNVNFNENVKSGGSRLVNRNPNQPNSFGTRQFLFATLFTNDGEIADGNIVAFENGLGNEVNTLDAVKIMNGGENFGISRTDSLLAVEAREEIGQTDTIFYNIQKLKEQAYQFRFAPVNIPGTITGYLIDRFLNNSTIISMTDSSFVDFTITGDAASNAADRFMLVFRQLIVVPVKIIYITANRNPDQTITVNWKVENETNMDHYEVERSEDGRSFTALGQTNPTNNNGGSADYSFQDNQPVAGDNYYRIKGLGIDDQLQYSSVVKVSAVKQAPSITVYPNPITDNRITVRFTNHQKGNYTVQLTNKLGQLMYNGNMILDQNNTTKIIQPITTMASGTYQLTIVAESGKQQIIPIIVP